MHLNLKGVAPFYFMLWSSYCSNNEAQYRSADITRFLVAFCESYRWVSSIKWEMKLEWKLKRNIQTPSL